MHHAIPYIFEKEIYAVASIIGASAFIVSNNYLDAGISVYVCFGVTLVIRLFAIGKNVHLKKVKIG